MKPHSTADTKWWSLAVASAALTVADVEMTQSCLQQRTCKELNPLLSTSRPGVYAVEAGLGVSFNYLSYRFKKKQSRFWWFPQAALIGSHAAGLATGLAH